jgi:hypothetical protein
MLKTRDIPIKNPEIKFNPSFDGRKRSMSKAATRDNTPIGIANL